MKETKNSVALILMVNSVGLLLILQFFWLKSAYRDASEDFRKETNLLFRNTIFAMHDSLIQRSLEPLSENDTMPRVIRERQGYLFNDTIRVVKEVPDSAFNIRFKQKASRIEIITSSQKGDSIGRLLRPIMRNLQERGEPKTFIFRMDADSLSSDSIRIHYQRALGESGIEAPFKIVALHMTPLTRLERTEIRMKELFSTDIVPFSPITQYAAAFSGIETLLIREILPQILFSFFLTLLTAGSFYVMYRNLRAQQRLMQIKNDFISNVTHELKTPVATVSVALEALKNFHALDNPQKTTEYLEIAQSELNRLTLMTDKILKTSVYEDQGVDLKPEPIDIDTIIQQVLASMKLVFEKKQIQMVYTKKGTDFQLAASQTHLTNVFYNLIDNALKYSNDGAVIEINLENRNDSIGIAIKDNGVGIPAEYHKKIFEKFFRVPSGDVHNIKGYGLGLSYVSSVVRSHGGEIHVESETGKGSCFVISLPVKPVE
jgi:two-component system, OmpR family, phosphate regulon sensor histidine kinase PhoR